MTYGFRCKNDDGVYQIDGETMNLVHTQTIAGSTGAGFIDSGRSNAGVQYQIQANTQSINVSAIAPLFVLYCPGLPATILKVLNPSANTWTVLVWTAGGNAAFELHVFDRADAQAAPGGFGMRIRNSANQVIYNSNQRLARVLGIAGGNIVNAGPGWGQWQPPQNFDVVTDFPVAKVGVGAIITPYIASGGASSSSFGYSRIQGFQCSGGHTVRSWRQSAIGGANVPGNEVAFGAQLDWSVMYVDLSYL